MAKLGEVCLLKAGKFVSANDISPEYNKGLYPCFGGNGIRGYVADYTHDGEFPLIGRQGALCGNVNLASGKFHATEHAVVVQPKIEMNVHWLYYALNAMNLGQYATGAAQPGLAVSKLETLSIEIPNISEQNKIAQTLYKVEQLVNFRKQQLAKLDELVKSRFVEMFGELQSNQKNLVKIGEIGTLSSGGTPSRTKPEYFNGKIRWYSAGELNDLYLKDSNEHISDDALNNSAAKLFEKDSLMIGMYDTAAFKMGILTEQSSSNQACANLKPNDRYNVIWLYYLFDAMKPVFLKERQGVRQKNLSLSKIKSFEVPSAPLSLQNEFATFVERVDQQKQTVQQSLEKLELMKKALMQEYFG